MLAATGPQGTLTKARHLHEKAYSDESWRTGQKRSFVPYPTHTAATVQEDFASWEAVDFRDTLAEVTGWWFGLVAGFPDTQWFGRRP